MGAVVAIVVIFAVERRALADMGLALDTAFFRSLGLGSLLGFAQVSTFFVAELGLGWIAFLGPFEVFVQGESFSLNILIDIVFHLAVSLHEELPLRGWLLLNMAETLVHHLETSANAALLLAALAQTALFALLHARSPGASRVGLLNLSVGGVAAACKVLCSGGIALPLGWHFAWNISMGNIYGLSTSGIPISATLLSVAPHPTKSALHGGEFGPEQSPLAPAIYVGGVLLTLGFCGWPDAAEVFPMLNTSRA